MSPGRPNNDVALGLEALRLYAQGMEGADVAAALHLAPGSVRGRMKKLYGHLGARNMVHAVVIAAIDGLLTREDLRLAYEDRRSTSDEEE